MSLSDYSVESPAEAFTKDAHPLVFSHLLMDTFEAEWVFWDPETTWLEVKETWKVDPSPQARDTINALRTCLVAETPWVYPRVFGLVCTAFNHGVADFSVQAQPSLGQILFTVRLLKQIDDEQTLDVALDYQIAQWAFAQGAAWLGTELAGADALLAPLAPQLRGSIPGLLAGWPTSLEELDIDEDDPAQMAALKWRLAEVYADQQEEMRIYV